MRRVVPWVLLGLVALGAGLGAALGATAPGAPGPPGVTPSQWVADLLARTAASGSARFSYAHVSTSTSPAYSGRIVGSGEVDFGSGTVRATEVDHQTEFTSSPGGVAHPQATATRAEFIGIGATMYQSFAPALVPLRLTTFPWAKLSWHRDPHQQLGLSFVGNAGVTLGELEGAWHVVGVRALGAATVGGVATTRYEVRTAPVCRPLHPSPLVQTQGSSFVWVDGRGRLVQITGTARLSGHLPPAIRSRFPSLGPVAPVTTTDTLRFSAFGVPVHVEAPPSQLVRQASGGAVIARLSCRS